MCEKKNIWETIFITLEQEKALTTKNDKFSYIKINNFFSKDTIKGVKRHAINEFQAFYEDIATRT